MESNEEYPFNAPPPIIVLWSVIESRHGQAETEYLRNIFMQANQRYTRAHEVKGFKSDLKQAEKARQEGRRPLLSEKALDRRRRILKDPQAYVDELHDGGNNENSYRY